MCGVTALLLFVNRAEEARVKRLMCPVAKDEALLEGGSSTSNTNAFHFHPTVEHFGIVMLTDLWRKVLQDTSGSWIKQ
jgi:hypothetical protein